MGQNIKVFDAIEHFHQPEKGYRFSIDSLLLADFVSVEGVARVADFGAGCGVVGLSTLEKKRVQSVGNMFFVEREPVILESLQDNITLYQPRTTTKLWVVPVDWRRLKVANFGGQLDYVMVNPPYFEQNDGRPHRYPAIEQARREDNGGLYELLKVLACLLSPKGCVALILPAGREEKFRSLLAEIKFNVGRTMLMGGNKIGKRLILAEICKSS